MVTPEAAGMDWETYSSASDFLDRARVAFMEDEALHSLALGVAQDLATNKVAIPKGSRFGAITDGTTVGGVYLHTPPHPMLWTPFHDNLEEDLLDHLTTTGGLPSQMQASVEPMRKLAEIRCARTGETAADAHHLRCHRLDRVDLPHSMPTGRMRLAQSDENDILRHWAYRFAVDCQLTAAIERGVPENTPFLSEDDLFVWDVEGEPVASAALTRSSPSSRTISFVYTPDDLRGRGYAGALVGSLSQLVLDSGKSFVTLFTDLTNPTSNKIYHQLGYRPVEDFLEVSFRAR